VVKTIQENINDRDTEIAQRHGDQFFRKAPKAGSVSFDGLGA